MYIYTHIYIYHIMIYIYILYNDIYIYIYIYNFIFIYTPKMISITNRNFSKTHSFLQQIMTTITYTWHKTLVLIYLYIPKRQFGRNGTFIYKISIIIRNDINRTNKRQIFLEQLVPIVVLFNGLSSHVFTKLSTACFRQVQFFRYSSMSQFLLHS